MEIETATEMETDMETESDNTRTWTWNCRTFAKHLIWRHSPNSAVWIFSVVSRRNFQRHYVLLELFHDEKMTCRISKIHTAIATALQPMC
jgi:hypothetical protein